MISQSNPFSRARGRGAVPVSSGQCKFFDREFIPSNQVTLTPTYKT